MKTKKLPAFLEKTKKSKTKKKVKRDHKKRGAIKELLKEGGY